MSKKGVMATFEKWPVLWRVTAPKAGCYDRDMVFLETDDHEAALKEYRSSRRAGYPVRLEQVRCGPLPAHYLDTLSQIREANAQSPGTSMQAVPAAWTDSA